MINTYLENNKDVFNIRKLINILLTYVKNLISLNVAICSSFCSIDIFFHEYYVNDQISLLSYYCGYGAANHGIFTDKR